MRALRWTFASPRAWVVTAVLLVLYGALYLLVARALIVDPSAGFGRFGPLPALRVTALSPHLLLSWIDPLFVLYVSDGVVLAPSAPALFTVVVLGALVGVNGAMAIETLARRPAACATDGTPWWLAAVIPSFLASFTCCAPTVLLLLGAGAAGAAVSLIPFVVPLAVVVLAASLVWSARRLEDGDLLVAT